jgi:protein-S-isoprenylcysteine O-methyltransferase Ste14
VALLAALVLLPTADHWGRPAWVLAVSALLTLGGLGVVSVAALALGSTLTATPEPRVAGTLRVDGMYRHVRHPIYSGVLLVVGGLALRSGNVVTATVGVATIVFFHLKARWEERRLGARYDEYAAYAARTPRFVPRLRP